MSTKHESWPLHHTLSEPVEENFHDTNLLHFLWARCSGKSFCNCRHFHANRTSFTIAANYWSSLCWVMLAELPTAISPDQGCEPICVSLTLKSKDARGTLERIWVRLGPSFAPHPFLDVFDGALSSQHLCIRFFSSFLGGLIKLKKKLTKS